MRPARFSLLLALALALPFGAALAADFKLGPAADHLDVLQDGKVVARYMHGYDQEKLTDTYKPYLHVFDAEGTAPITKGPGGDFPHHRGIFIGWNKIVVHGKTHDRWHMKGGSQIHQKFTEQGASKDGATLTSHIFWEGESNTTILEEYRTIRFLPSLSPYYATIDLTSRIQAISGNTELGGDPEHAGIQFRPAQEVDRSKTSYLYPIENANPTKDLDYPWFAENFVLNGKNYSVVYLNHSKNPKDARTSAYRDYGRFGAFFKTTIPEGTEATFQVRLLIAQGPLPSAEAIQSAWNAYTGETAPTPKTTLKEAAKKK